MKMKRFTALFLSLVMALSLVCVPAYAGTANELKSDVVLEEGTVGGKTGIFVNWKVTTGADGILTANIALAYDKTVFDLVDSEGNVLAFPDAEPPVLNAAQLIGCDFELFNDLYAKNGSENTAIIAFVRSAFFNAKVYTSPTTIGQFFLAYKTGKSAADVTADALRYATADEAAVVAQSSVIGMGDGLTGEEYKYGTTDSSDTADWENNLSFGEDFTFAKPAYSGTVAAPTVKSNVAGKVELNEVTPSAGGTVQYGYSTEADGTGITWQNGTTFNLTVGSTYYFYAKVVATADYNEKVSDASAAVLVADKLTPEYTVPTGLKATYGDKLSTVVLPEGWSWEAAADATVGNKGTNTFKATFTPADTDTYAAVTDIDVPVEVAAKTITVTVGAINAQQYTGSQIKPEVLVDGGMVTLNKNDYIIKYGDNVEIGDEAGSVTVEPAEGSNYTFTAVTKKFNIVAQVITPTVELEGWTYGENANEPTVSGNTGNGTVTYEYKVKDADDSTYTTTVPTDAGEYTVKASVAASGNYGEGVATDDFTIAKADFTTTVSIEGWTYGETAKTPAVGTNTSGGTVTYEYKAQGSDVFTTSAPTNAGTHTVKATIAATDNYNAAEATAEFVIAKAAIEPTVTLDDWTYGGTAKTPDVKGNPGNGAVSYEYSADDFNTVTTTVPTDAGTYTVKAVIAATDNYEGGVASDTFTINKAEQTIAGSHPRVKILNTLDLSTVFRAQGELSFEISGGATITGTTLTAGNTPGEYDLTVTAAETANYKEKVGHYTVTITEKDTQAIAADDVIATYGDTNKKVEAASTGTGTISYAVTAGADVVEVNASTGALTIKKAGTATVTVTAAENADFAEQTKEVTVTVNPKEVNVPTADTTTYTYNGKEQTYKVAENAAYTVTDNKQTNAGTYTVTVALKDNVNYKWSDNTTAAKTFTFEIKKATITVKADDIAIKVNETVPAATYTVTGLVNGETLIKEPTVAIEGTVDNTKEGQYTITASGAEAPNANYNDIVYVAGKLTISNKNTVITPVGPKPQQPTQPEEPEVTPSFGDIAGEWFEADVEYVAEKGLMNGVGDGSMFAPLMDTSRGMIVTILWRMEGQPVPMTANTFKDVEKGAYYEQAVAWAAEKGIVNGYGDTFGPNDNITREQFATILFRYAQFKGYDVSVGEDTNILSYADAFSISEYAIPAMQWACGAGLINGIGDTLQPAGAASRAQAAAILHRFCENVAK